MAISAVRSKTKIVPAPRLAVTSWLSAPAHSTGADEGAELRATMFRRLEPVLASAIVTLIIVFLGAVHHPTLLFRTWLVLDTACLAIRVPLLVYLMRFMRQTEKPVRLSPWVVDAFIMVGTCWSALLGFGCVISFCSQDCGLSVLVSLLCLGTAGAQCARNLSSPRLNSVQMSLIMVPLTAGAWFSGIPLMNWVLLLSPIFLFGMMGITYQLHHDYVLMIIARLENQRLALHCSLTGLPNRAFFEDVLKTSLEDAERPNRSVAVLCLDLDGFKAVNDDLGHPMGDVLLQQVAQRLRAVLRSNDFAARLGGDEFAVLLRPCGRADAEMMASRLIDAVAQPFVLGARHEARIGVSVGITVASQMDGPARLMIRADRALYAAKRAGRGTLRFFNEPPSLDAFGGDAAGLDGHARQDPSYA